MKRFGFYSTPPLETPSNERAPSGLYKGTELFDPKEDTDVDPGRFAFGQERLLVTPLQMAMLAATVANDGVVMRPYVVDRVVAPDGSIVVRTKPQDLGRAVKRRDGAGGRGDDAGGRRGRHRHRRADLRADGRRQDGNRGDRDRGPEHDLVHQLRRARTKPEVAIAVVVEQQNSTGGATAAPVARDVLQALLGGAANS